jgi:hypothetical protein
MKVGIINENIWDIFREINFEIMSIIEPPCLNIGLMICH